MSNRKVAAALQIARRAKKRRADGGEVSYDPMTGLRIGADTERTEPEAAPNRYARATIQSIANMPKAALWDAPRELGEAVERMPAPGAERTPENEAAMQNAAGQSFMTAVGTAGGSMPFAKPGAAGIFGGRLAQTADHAALARAEEMHAAGAPQEQIHADTGWFMGPDDKWRFEIDDGLSGFRRQYGRGTIDNYPISNPHTTDIGSAYNHPGLQAAYPDLMHSDLSFYHHPNSDTRGSYRPPVAETPGDLIPPPGEQINIRTPDDRYGKNMDQTRSTMLHEMQHAVQTREGFVPGSSPQAMEQVVQAGKDARLWQGMIEAGHTPEEISAAFPKVMGRPAHPAAPMLAKQMTPEQLAKIETDPYEAYRRVYGEVEARNVQKRRDMTPEERRASFPGSTEDIPREKQLIGAPHDPTAPPLAADAVKPEPGAAADTGAVGPGGGGPGGNASLQQAQAAAGRPQQEFRDWFGNSKIVDENGLPRVAYKAMQGDAPHMQPDTGLTHVALNPEVARQFSHNRDLREVHVKSEKPFDFRNPSDLSWLTREMQKPENVAAYNRDTKRIMGEGYDYEHSPRDIAAALEDGAYQAYEVPSVSRLIRGKGYDGIYMVEEHQRGEPNLAVFDPSQIKLKGADGSLPEAQSRAARWAGERKPLEGLPGALKIGDEDAGSRAPGQQGSHNYVMFGDDKLNIHRKYRGGGGVNAAMKIARKVKKRADGGATFGVLSPGEEAEQPEGMPAKMIRGAATSLATLPKRAYESSQRMVETGEYDPAPIMEAAMLPMGTGAFAGVKSLPGEVAMGVIPVDVGRAFNIPSRIPDSDVFRRAVQNTPGAAVDAEALTMPISRGQKIEQEMEPSTRGGVFYLPEGSHAARYYTGKGANFTYGGQQKISGETAIKAPLFVKGATGGKAPEAAFDQLAGRKGAYEDMRTDALRSTGAYYLPREDKTELIRQFLEKYAPEMVDQSHYIGVNSQKGNQLAYALQEAAVASAARRAGHDAVVGYSTRRGPSKDPFISEVFDVRESHYPGAGGEFQTWPESIFGPGKEAGGRAMGGGVGPALNIARSLKRARGGKVHTGAILGHTDGRADKVPMEVPDGAYVLTADHCSSMGEGNTLAGFKKLDRMFPKSAAAHATSKIAKRARGGAVPIYAADGEYVIHPSDITDRWGDLEAGHRYLDAWQTASRKEHVNTLRNLAPPAQD